MDLRRIGIYALIVAVLPTCVGLLAVALNLFHDQPTTPQWIHATRIVLSWVGVILVYAHLVRRRRRRWPARAGAVLLLSWLIGLVLQAVAIMVLQAFPGTPELGAVVSAGAWIRDLGIGLARAALGSALGLWLPQPREV